MTKEYPKKGTLVFLVTAQESVDFSGHALDRLLNGQVSRAIKANRFTGAEGQTLVLLAPERLEVDRVVLLGLGKLEKLTKLKLKRSAAQMTKALLYSGERQASVWVGEFQVTESQTKSEGLSNEEVAAELAFGVCLRAYRFSRYKTKEPAEKTPTLSSVSFVCKAVKKAQRLFNDKMCLVEGITLARDLVSEPSNVLTPPEFARRCQETLPSSVGITRLDKAKLTRLKMNALLAVGQGSVHDPYVLTFSYQGDESDNRPLIFVGKGVTFDAGGISLKPAGGMEDMKMDMSGAAVVVGLMKCLALRKACVNAMGIIGIVENMPSGSAMKPGDIVVSGSGQTIEIQNTDAEGRLILADLLWYAQKHFTPRHLIDLATLTGAIVIALGHEYAGLFSNNDDLADALVKTGRKVDEKAWSFPLGRGYDKEIDSNIADMKNIGTRGEAGSIIGAQFLKRFVRFETSWAHLDIAGVSWTKKSYGTGFGVYLLDQWIRDYHET